MIKLKGSAEILSEGSGFDVRDGGQRGGGGEAALGGSPAGGRTPSNMFWKRGGHCSELLLLTSLPGPLGPLLRQVPRFTREKQIFSQTRDNGSLMEVSTVRLGRALTPMCIVWVAEGARSR